MKKEYLIDDVTAFYETTKVLRLRCLLEMGVVRSSGCYRVERHSFKVRGSIKR
jgi:hypothetical protein